MKRSARRPVSAPTAGCSWTLWKHDESFRRAAVAGSGADEVAVMADQQPPATKPRSHTRLAIQAGDPAGGLVVEAERLGDDG
jgi:hypothetical protein